MKRLLVTGRHGFVGGTLARLVATEPVLTSWQLADIQPKLDLCEPDAADAMVAAAEPDAVLHLAAQSWVPDAIRDPEATIRVNLLGTLHLLQALQRRRFRGRMVFVSSGDIYGRLPDDALPVSEARLPAPRNPYAVSKLAAEALCHQWAVTEGMEIVLARPFNHIGPGQSDRFVISDFARQIAEIKLGRHEPMLAVGDIDVTRDFTDVRDVVHAYFALLRDGKVGEAYNVCSGREYRIGALLDQLIALAGVEVRIETDSARLRKAEQRRVCGDPAKIQQATGWRATTPVAETLSAMLQYWETEMNNG